jgi:hypothetical protein
MTRRARIGAVVVGDVVALAAARGAAWWYDARAAALPYDTSGGMYAFGKMITAVGAFLAVALPVGALALWPFLRRTTVLRGLTTAAAAFVGTCVLAVLAAL